MKKGLMIFALLIAGFAWYVLSGAGDFIRSQIEQQGSKYLGAAVSVASVDLALTEGRMDINSLNIENPSGFSNENAFSVDSITLDLGDVINEPYIVQTININAPTFLYELDAGGQGNLLVLKDNLMANLPKTNNESASKEGANPLLIVENVTVSKVRLKFNFEKLSTGDLKIDTKEYEVILPTFNAGPLGQPNGLPADQVGLAVINAMLDNVISAAKSEVKKRLAEEAKKKVKEELEKQKDKLLEKASDKLKGILS
ncbi:AsmA family protein [Paraglaciecola hydrolytica]|uniref:AsmA domain-containing protein n=1 Tax=Paraglaciecola hydrolytica TaxID=1799789 RepID=A0A148KN79_9ALTE|nr:hypothetical protein [Paraglaciecola hydrolytica]KXI27695.1 hypothetical protein AX660_19270 [Paraglaciecola hydrolytica]